MKKSEIVWLNGKCIDFNDAQVPLLSHALHYGTAVYEGIRAYETTDGTAIFRLRDHVDRLFASAAALGIKIPYSRATIERAICDVVAKNKFSSCYIRPLVFYGEGQMTLFPRGAKIHIAIAAWPWPAYLGEHKLLSTCISPYIRFHPRSIVAGAKISGLYAISTIATIDARTRGFDECIMLDHEGNVAEGPGENIFIVRAGKLFTPNSASILRGITRESVMVIARDLRIPVVEKKITPRDLLNADEAFFTGTATEVAAIGKVDRRTIGKKKNENRAASIDAETIANQIRETYIAAVHGKLPRYKKWLDQI